MAKNTVRQWREISTDAVLCVTGGYAQGSRAVKSRVEHSAAYGVVTFAHVTKTEEWIIEAATGKTDRHALKRSKLIDDLKRKLDPESPDADAVVAAVAADAPDDPMHFMDALHEPEGKKRKGTAARKVRSKRGKNCPRMIDMPAKEPNKHPDAAGTYQALVLPASTNSIWLRQGDLPWFLEYLADEVGPAGSHGVPPIEGGGCDDEPNCAAENVYMEWDFVDTVSAKWVQGPLKGKTVKTTVSTLTEEKWSKMDALHTYGVSFEDANPLDLKQAAWHYVEAHCIVVNAPRPEQV